MPIAVQGPHRAMRLTAFHPPRAMPSRAITISAYRLQVGVKRQRRPARAASGDNIRWYA